MEISINIKKDFSEYPGLRYQSLSDHSGEIFYHKHLNSKFTEAYQNKDTLTVILDETEGYSPSFLDEAFGNLVYDFSKEIVEKHIQIISEEEPYWKDMIKNETFEIWEDRRKQKKDPKVTAKHEAWYRLVNNSLELKVWEVPAK